MSKKRLLIIVITIVCVLLILIAAYYTTSNTPKHTDENQPSNNSPQDTSESLIDSPETIQGSPNPSTSPLLDNTQNETPHNTNFVVPENPLGTIGIITSIATALGIFAIKQRRKTTP
jgi:cytoskeletal protein RodZ